ncbi:DUF6089 family protein [Fulvivirgaceae bacterium BMA12]|uniref:DUF6089 family protein n=1 Tax=Agaribacillus aureus TaxID=3051825 RepID=A0ABT8LG70_9BACT|nr:DUF6089 family protein [Fulvivirgaceae bacterium BMA12]
MNKIIKHLNIGKPQIGFPIFVTLLFIGVTGYAQKYEVGAGVGGFSYTGDLIKNYQIKENSLGGLVYYKTNLSDAISLRYAVTLGKLQGSDENPFDAFAAARNASFDIFIIEPTATLEYNFLDYRTKNSVVNFSPYFFAGAGFFTFFGQEESPFEYSSFQPVIPFGVGIKYDLNRNWRLNFEFGARKTFFDYLDNVSEAIPNNKNYQYGNPNDNDTYYFIGVSVSYAFYPIICPFDYN